jgi:RNA polymerase sigma factor (sigma-70 family)
MRRNDGELRMVQSDSVLIAACRRGDPDAWEALVMRYQRLIYAIPLRAGLDEQQASEVFQTVFEKLVQRLGDLEQPDRVHAWLVTTAKRESWRSLRQQKAGGIYVSVDDKEAQELPAALPLPNEVVQKLEDQHLVRSSLQQLEENCRSLLTALFYQETALSYTEVAAALGIPPGSIGPTRARCLQKLRDLLVRAGF